MKVTEEEHEVVEKEIDAYVCDRCGDEMGTDPDHNISVNPTLKFIDEAPAATRATDTTIDTITQVGKQRRPIGDLIVEEEDDSMEWCASCVKDVFNVGVAKSVEEQAERVKDDDVSGLFILLIAALMVGVMFLILLL